MDRTETNTVAVELVRAAACTLTTHGFPEKHILAQCKLPADCPYVGNFHRGYSVTPSIFQGDAAAYWHILHRLAVCPYIDTRMDDDISQLSLAQETSLEERCPLQELASSQTCPQTPSTASRRSLDDKCSAANTPISSPHAQCLDFSNEFSTRGPPTTVRGGWRFGAFNRSLNMGTSRAGARENRSTSFSDVKEFISQKEPSFPLTPELCGVQAILPRQSGLSVQTKLGEGSFAKVVMALNKRNTAQETCTFARAPSVPTFGQKGAGQISRIMHLLPRTGAQVVLKVIKKVVVGCMFDCLDEGAAAQQECIAREVSIHGRVDHVNIPRMYGYYEDMQHLVMILDLVPGKELKEVLVLRRTIPEDEIRILSLQVASALQYLHEQCVVHRDVSPRNILIQGRKAWLIDLGLAVDLKVADAETVKSAGTLGYMAPEALRGAKVHVSGDMWALGIVIYEALFGFSPFLPHELHVPSAVVQFPDPAWGLHASSEAKLALTALLEKDPTRRLSAADLLGEHAWAAPVALAEMEALLVDEYARRAADAREAAAESEETAQAGRRRGLAEWGSEGEGNGVVGPEWLTRVTAAEVREAVGCQSRGCRPLRERAVSIM